MRQKSYSVVLRPTFNGAAAGAPSVHRVTCVGGLYRVWLRHAPKSLGWGARWRMSAAAAKALGAYTDSSGSTIIHTLVADRGKDVPFDAFVVIDHAERAGEVDVAQPAAAIWLKDLKASDELMDALTAELRTIRSRDLFAPPSIEGGEMSDRADLYVVACSVLTCRNTAKIHADSLIHATAQIIDLGWCLESTETGMHAFCPVHAPVCAPHDVKLGE